MTGDIFSTSNIPEFRSDHKNAELKKRKLDIATLQDSDKKVADLEKKEFLEHIDFATLRQLFVEHYQKSGLVKNEINFLGPEGISFNNHTNFCGYYDPNENYISIPNPTLIQKKIDIKQQDGDWVKKNYGNVTLHALHCLIHEETHATSGNRCASTDPTEESQSGYQKGRKFTAFDEGVVEKLAREITVSYLDRTGVSSSETATLKENLQKNSKETVYSDAVKMIDVIIDRITDKTGVQKTTVWQAIIKGLFEGETFNSPEVRGLFTQSFGENFLNQLANIPMAGFNMKGESQVVSFLKYHSLIQD